MHVRKDGSNFPVEASLSYINNGDEYMIAVVRDITNQLKMEEKIKQKAQELERLQKVISKTVLYTTTDLDGNITSVSKAFEELSGYKESELIGKKHSLFKNPNTPKEFYKGMWEVLNSDEQFIGEIKNYTKEKSDYWIKLTIDPLFDEDGKKIGYSSYRENITDKKELAKKDQ
ncbi:MAG: PAS domain-containing protein, partial [Campylobacterota bacterium]|nr:PAS domain-containing protein [Campylobacterota bacterium]